MPCSRERGLVIHFRACTRDCPVGLDAVVYCDCFERDRLKARPMPAWKVQVNEQGQRVTGASALPEQLAFDQWDMNACEHEGGILVHHYIGNVARVTALRQSLAEHGSYLPVIMSRVVNNATHAGDFLSLEQVERVALELDHLASLALDDPEKEGRLRHFESQMRDLATAALKLKKPIVF